MTTKYLFRFGSIVFWAAHATIVALLDCGQTFFATTLDSRFRWSLTPLGAANLRKLVGDLAVQFLQDIVLLEGLTEESSNDL